jgi:hypothetical protein
MAVITNKNTTQAPHGSAGVTATQVVKFIPASRVYIKTAESTSAAPVQNYYTKSDGATPSGWTDLGTMLGEAKLTYNVERIKVKTGIDKALRAVYTGEKDGSIEFNLSQMDDYLMAQLGLTSSTIVNGSSVNFRVGQENVIQKALLCVYQNKLDGKEMQIYHPAAYLSFIWDEVDDGIVFKTTADLSLFTGTGQTVEQLMSVTFFA